jgi:glycosyltransferase involved in cell wall biosynthesis
MMKISVCMATFNGEKYIAAQIESILKQIAETDELVISDDGSTDATLKKINGFRDPRIRVIESGGLRNPIFNFEKAIAASSGDVIVLCDQDDVWLDGRVNLIRELFIGRLGSVYAVVLDSIVVDGQLNEIYPSLFEYLNAGPGVLKNIFRITYVGCHMAFSRKLIEIALPFPKRIPMHDVWLGLIAEIFGKVVFINQQTMLFRRHGENATKSKYLIRQRIKWRIFLTLSLISISIRRITKI